MLSEMRPQFLEFLKDTYSQENGEFWYAVQEYKSAVSKDAGVGASEYAKKFIYETYIKSGARSEVNIDSHHRESVDARLPLVDKDGTLFDECQTQAFLLMLNDSLGKFIRSPSYTLYTAGAKSLRPIAKKDKR